MMPIHFGTALAAGCDLDGDGYSDAVVGSAGSGGPGLVSVYFGGPAGLATTPAYEIDNTFAALGDGVGAAVACNGDFNGDGQADLAVGAFEGETNTLGSVAVFSGGARTRGTPLWSVRGVTTFTELGTVLEFVGDQDGVAGDELAVGEPGAMNGTVREAGLVKIVRYRAGGMTTAEVLLRMTLASERFGAAIVSLGPIGPAGESGFAVGIPTGGTDQSGLIDVFYRGAITTPVRPRSIIPTSTAGMGTRYGARFAR
jgi:hypothetical protein